MTTVLLLLLCVVVEVQSQTYPFIRHRRSFPDILSNHSYLSFNEVGVSRNWRLECHTDLATCCTSNQGPDRGDWFFPNGSVLQFEESGDDIYQTYPEMDDQQIHLHRHGRDINGIYQCTIETNAVNNDTGREIVYVGLYASGGEVYVYSVCAIYINITYIHVNEFIIHVHGNCSSYSRGI